MKSLLAILTSAFLLASCAKEELVPPAAADQGMGKLRVTSMPMDEVQQGAPKPGSTAGEGGSISDDGDDAGHGERNRKKKPNS
jgi:hypothetical protein